MVVQGKKPIDPLKNPVPRDERTEGLTNMINNQEAMKAINTMNVNDELLDKDPDAFFKMLEEASGGEIQCIPLGGNEE